MQQNLQVLFDKQRCHFIYILIYDIYHFNICKLLICMIYHMITIYYIINLYVISIMSIFYSHDFRKQCILEATM